MDESANLLAPARGAKCSKALLPVVSNGVIDGNLVTGQNSGSAKEAATEVAALR